MLFRASVIDLMQHIRFLEVLTYKSQIACRGDRGVQKHRYSIYIIFFAAPYYVDIFCVQYQSFLLFNGLHKFGTLVLLFGAAAHPPESLLSYYVCSLSVFVWLLARLHKNYWTDFTGDKEMLVMGQLRNKRIFVVIGMFLWLKKIPQIAKNLYELTLVGIKKKLYLCHVLTFPSNFTG